LIVIFAQSYGVLPDGRKVKHYYARESVGIATGILITVVHMPAWHLSRTPQAQWDFSTNFSAAPLRNVRF
jgi:hypothetical protein